MTPLVTLERVSLGYHGHTVLRGLDFSLPEGDFLGLVGPNGAGKTTILRALLGTLRPMEGTVWRASGLRIGYVPQGGHVSAHFPLRVLDVVLMGRYGSMGLGRRPGAADRAAAHRALAHAGIDDLADSPITELSGGQRQRTLLARALVGEPTLLVLDEPTAGMDLVSTTQILGLVRDLHERGGHTVLMVSHALNEVANYVTRIALVARGRLIVGPVEEVLTEEALHDVFGIPVDVRTLHGSRVVLARRHPSQGAPSEPARATGASRDA